MNTKKERYKGSVSLQHRGVRRDMYQWAPLHVCLYIFRSFLEMEQKEFYSDFKTEIFFYDLSFEPF